MRCNYNGLLGPGTSSFIWSGVFSLLVCNTVNRNTALTYRKLEDIERKLEDTKKKLEDTKVEKRM